MAAPERFADRSDSSCTAGAVHTWPICMDRPRVLRFHSAADGQCEECAGADREKLCCQCEYDQQAVKEDRMAKFLAFKDHRGQEIYVNAALVRAVRSEGESGAWIDFDGEHSIRTPSPANTVVRDLEKAV